MAFAIVSDSSCDLSVEQAAELNIDIIPFYISFNAEEFLRETVDITVSDFYQRLVDNPGLFPSTSMPSITDYYSVFERHVLLGNDVLCLTLTAKFSGSYNSARLAGEAICEKYPDANIKVLDSTVITVLQGLFVQEAVDMRDAGMSIEDSYEKLREIQTTGRIFFTIGDMEYLVHGGRVGKVLQLAGDTLKLRPIITFEDGELAPSGAAFGRELSKKKVIEKLLAHFKKHALSPNDYNFCVGHGWDRTEAITFAKAVLDRLKKIGYDGIVSIGQIGSTIGVHTGPHPLGVVLMKKHSVTA